MCELPGRRDDQTSEFTWPSSIVLKAGGNSGEVFLQDRNPEGKRLSRASGGFPNDTVTRENLWDRSRLDRRRASELEAG